MLEYLTGEYFSTLIYIYNYQKYVVDYLSSNFKNKYTYDEIRLLYPEILDNYINSVMAFIRRIKGNNHNINDFHKYLSKAKFSGKNKNDRVYKNKLYFWNKWDI